MATLAHMAAGPLEAVAEYDKLAMVYRRRPRLRQRFGKPTHPLSELVVGQSVTET